MKKNLVVFITTYQSPHYEASLHFAEKYRNDYGKVIVINLVKFLSYRHEYTWRNYLPFKLNVSRKIRNGLNKSISYYIYKLNKKKIFQFPECMSFDKGNICESDIHQIMETYSCTEYGISFLRNNKYSKKLRETITETDSIIDNLVKKKKIKAADDILLFNGRLPVEFTIQKKLRKIKNLNFIFHECNNYQNKIYYMRHSLHKLDLYQNEIENFYKENESKVLEYWFKNKTIKDATEKKYITYFTSSNDEYKFTYEKPINQSKIIKELLDVDFGKYELKIRVHPNTINKDISVRRYWKRIESMNPDVIINYDNNRSSYELCKNSLFTISIGSSIAAESIILDTPHILIGNQNWYYNFPGYIKISENNFNEFIKSKLRNYSYFLDYKIDKKEKKLAASSQLFLKLIGERIKITLFGKYPTPDNFNINIEKYNE